MVTGIARGFTMAAGAALVVSLLPAGSALAEESPKTTKLSLSIKEEGSNRIVATLHCNPPGGSHPNRVDACAEIKSAGGELDKLPGRQTFAACAKIYLPILAKANGLAEGKNVDYRRRFPNRCEMGVATGSVFELFGDR